MIEYLHGNLVAIDNQHVVIDINGIGYRVGITHSDLDDLPKLQEKLHLYIYHQFSDTGQVLWGFRDIKTRKVFSLLITVKNIGAKVAMNILSSMSIDMLILSVLNNQPEQLVVAPGIGKKTAQRIILELQDKINKMRNDLLPSIDSVSLKTAALDAEAVLLTLGYAKTEITKILTKTIKEYPNATTDEVIRYCLKNMDNLK